MAKAENPVQLGVIGAAHGIRGEVRVKVYTEDLAALGGYGPLFTGDGRALVVKDIRPAKGIAIVRFEGVTSRNEAEALNGEALFVDRSALPEDLEDEEFYHTDLIGLTVLDETGKTIGKVVAIHDFGAGDLLEVRPASGPTHMIPFTRDAVPKIELSEGVIRVDSMAAGLNGQVATESESQPEGTADGDKE